MSTRSAIGFMDSTGTISAIYCHHDGYLRHVGQTLHKHYSTPQKIQHLISLGDLSSLGAYIGEKHDFDSRPRDTCTFYHRDREEPWNETSPESFLIVQDFVDAYNGVDFCYLNKEGVWYVKAPGEQFVNLFDALETEREDQSN